MHDELVKRGGRLLVISTDTPQEAKDVVDALKLPFPILSDPEAAVIRSYGLLHEKGGPGRQDIAIPGHVLVAPDGAIRWRFASRTPQDRVNPAEILAVLATTR